MDAKPLILCADDYAASSAISNGITQLARAGRLSATSVMTLSPRWAQDAPLLRELRDQIDVGLHLDWTSPFARAAGHGLTLGRAMLRAALGGFDRERARIVIERQLDAFEAQWQAPPDHVDGHQHVQQFAGIRQALVETLARRYASHIPKGGAANRMGVLPPSPLVGEGTGERGQMPQGTGPDISRSFPDPSPCSPQPSPASGEEVSRSGHAWATTSPPWLRVSRVGAGQAGLKGRAITALGAAALARLAADTGLPCAPELWGVYDFTGGPARYTALLEHWLARSPARAVLMCHPAHGPDEAADTSADPIAPARQWEYDVLRSAAFGQALARHGVVLTRGSAVLRYSCSKNKA